ncbi:hypothetical protein LTR84_002214 [Exophiala bonariae]|uniref:Up-regulated during septation protein 1 domain-containing protein n=1 Tax=Exophiala bonariae TaxID=1690606 RepID=A0AAV9NF98_9EURO|nr:hypothetical protein LTR84_002214 [Exophiala bonariae]
MDSFSHEPEDVKSKLPGPSGLLLSRVISAPEPRRHDGPAPFPFDLTPLKRDSPMDRPPQRSASELSSPYARQFWPSAVSSPPQDDATEIPDKRPRLEHIPERVDGEVDTRKDGGNNYSGRYDYPEYQDASARRPTESGLHRPASGLCHNCYNTESLIVGLVKGFLDLQAEISQALSIPLSTRSPIDNSEAELSKLGLKESLAWSIREIHNTTRLIHHNTATRPGLPPLSDVVPTPFVNDIRRLSLHAQSPAASPSINDPRKTLTSHDPVRMEAMHRRPTDQPIESTPRPLDRSLPAIIPPDEMRRSQQHEHMVTGIGQSPHPSSASSIFGSAQSPMQSHPSSLALPSPPGAHFARTGSSGSAQYSPTATPAAHHTHLQDLQHQISTKTLALQTLQREHDQLLAAFSRSQIRCTALDKKSQVSDHEINTLTEDKIRLQQEVESMESQIRDLMKSRDEVHQQSSADGAQWRQIMAMSSQLQLKGADDARRFRDERENWEAERESLRRRVEELESGKEALPETRTVSSSTTPVANDFILTSDSVETLRAEIVRLRRKCTELELMLQELASEAGSIESAINAMESVRKTLVGKKRRSDEG